MVGDEQERPADPTRRPTPAASDRKTTSDEHAAQAFYEVLRRNGQLVDVDADADLTTLAPHITHVRYPDGRVARVGFE